MHPLTTDNLGNQCAVGYLFITSSVFKGRKASEGALGRYFTAAVMGLVKTFAEVMAQKKRPKKSVASVDFVRS